jgi:hypothetical protein
MTRTVLKSRVGNDGTLLVSVPLGSEEANREVTITIEPTLPASEEHAKYVAWLESVAGKWQGEFERLPQREFEQRDSF